jgi:hypothetical protein
MSQQNKKSCPSNGTKFYPCRHPYALCVNAPCVQKGRFLYCKCNIFKGLSIATRPCPLVAPFRYKHQNYIFSTYSPITLPKSRATVCGENSKGAWGNCLNRICKVDPRNKNIANCYCIKMKTPSYILFPLKTDPNHKPCNSFYNGAPGFLTNFNNYYANASSS